MLILVKREIAKEKLFKNLIILTVINNKLKMIIFINKENKKTEINPLRKKKINDI